MWPAMVLAFVTATLSVNIPQQAEAPTVTSSEIKKEVTELEHRQNTYLSALEFCESGGNKKVKILDSNNKHSYGAFQFQMATFLGFGKQYDVIASTTNAEQGEQLIYDYELQRSIAKRMLGEGLEGHWKICTSRLGNYPKK